MIVIGLTGSMGMGKTTAANMLRDMGIPVHCSDESVHGLLNKGGAGVSPVMKRFPGSYNKKKDCIDRKKLRDIMGLDHDSLDDLEALLHPLVISAQEGFVCEQKAARQKIVVLDIPLLFETGAEKRVDFVLCVTAPEAIQNQRVMSRDGMTEDVFDFFLSRQVPDIEKRKRSDFVIQTGNGMAETRRSLGKVIKSLKKTQTASNKQRGPSCKR